MLQKYKPIGMNKTSTRTAHFDKMHKHFSESYKLINEYVGEVYQLPIKLIDETEPAFDRYIRDCVIPGEPSRNMQSLPVIVEFIDDLDQFTTETLELFDEHTRHLNKSTLYLRKLSGIQGKAKTPKLTATKVTYTQLGKELTQLNKDLKGIKERADEVVSQLEKLELTWRKIKHAIQS